MMFKKYFFLTVLLSCSIQLNGQTPMVVPLDHNPALRNSKLKIHNEINKIKSSISVDTVSLPFFDDFSYYWQSSKPDRKLWMDDCVYINNHYPVQPRSNGVATFDALDANGNIYQNTTSTFSADTLTSCPIDLGVSELNHVYLSFFYQPGGYGDCPDSGDSLLLQFKTPVTDKWRTVWNTPGAKLHPFKQVLLPVEDEYLQRGFQFRFVNLVSLSQEHFNPGMKSNADLWHIDYVRLDKNRSETDTATLDVAVMTPMKSLIVGYQAIPWKQCEYAFTTKLKPRWEITYRNNNNIAHMVYRNLEVTDVYRNITDNQLFGGADEIEAGAIMTFEQDIYNPFRSPLADSALFEIKGYLETDMLDRKDNDTVRYFQFFGDYFARDDGSPESGYGFSGYNAQDCAVACRYETFTQDTIRAIMLYFNPTADNATVRYRFRIAVWHDDNGRPGEPVYLSSKEYTPETTGQFLRFDLEKPVYVTKYYWIGWVQVTTGFLNAGFDLNYNDRGNLWYNDGTWKQDINNGTLMIRPVMGKRKGLLTSSELPAMYQNNIFKVYPNPAVQQIRIKWETFETLVPTDYDVEIYDVTGRLRKRELFTDNYLDVSSLEVGIYFLRVIHRKSGNVETQKVMIYR